MDVLRLWRIPGCSVDGKMTKGGLFDALKDADVMESLAKEDANLMEAKSDATWHSQSVDARKALITKKAWDVALTPVKALAMNVVMIFMTGAGGGFFGFIIIGYALLQAVRILLNVNKPFDDLEKSAEGIKINTLLQRLTYFALAAVFTAYFLYQAAKIGLLPTGQSGANIDFDQPPMISHVITQ